MIVGFCLLFLSIFIIFELNEIYINDKYEVIKWYF